MTAAQALAAPRLHNQILPNVSFLERASNKPGQDPVKGFSDEVAQGLEAKGHKVEWMASTRSVPCAIKFSYPGSGPDSGDNGRVEWDAAAEPRKYDSGPSVYYANRK